MHCAEFSIGDAGGLLGGIVVPDLCFWFARSTFCVCRCGWSWVFVCDRVCMYVCNPSAVQLPVACSVCVAGMWYEPVVGVCWQECLVPMFGIHVCGATFCVCEWLCVVGYMCVCVCVCTCVCMVWV